MSELRAWLRRFLFAPQPIVRLELIRVLVPLALLGFLSSRLIHADEWLSKTGFHVPDMHGNDWRQALYLPPLPSWAAWCVAASIVVSALALSAGYKTRAAAAALTTLLVYVVLADRLETFTVTKLGPVLCLALFLSPAGARYGIDAWRRHRLAPNLPQPTHVSGGSVRFFQIFLVVFYSGSGIAKLNGDWTTANVLWSHVHDNYETSVSHLVQRVLPAAAWGFLQWVTLTFEVGAPLWFALPWTRTIALCVGLGMHAMIGLMFGPVIWFSCLMSALLVACYFPKLPRRVV